MKPHAVRHFHFRSSQETIPTRENRRLRAQVAADVQAFLGSGGEITKVEPGVSGYKPTANTSFLRNKK